MTPITQPIASKLDKLSKSGHLGKANYFIELGHYGRAVDELNALYAELTSISNACRGAALKLAKKHWSPLLESADA